VNQRLLGALLLAMSLAAASYAAGQVPDGNLAIEPLPPPQSVEKIAAPEHVAEGGELLTEAIVAPPPPPPKIWEGSLEFGVNGTEGNSETFNFRVLTNAKRTTDRTILSLNTRYVKNTADSTETAHRFFFEGRDELLFSTSPWTLYVHQTTEYDEFRAFDLRVTGDAGLGYQFFKNDAISLLGRAGPGFSQEIGGPDDSVVPEAVLGLAYEHKITQRTKFTASTDYYPDVSDFGDFRLNSQANWEMVLDEALHLSLKLGVLDRYDSTPNGVEPNDLDYSATILWSF
jgi:putative salt-induced outer membrane protein YdiY